jgi:hypothetical protein
MRAITLILFLLHAAVAQQASSPPAADGDKFAKDQLEQIAAPIALYPDALLAQVMMAATCPLEIVEAAPWAKSNAGLKGDRLDAQLKGKAWDPSVKALCALPDVLQRMNDNLDWTQDLGDAFLGQKEDLMDTVQELRRKALDAGNLKSSKELKVEEQADKIIVIESPDPEVIYVPTYYPSAAYGGWSYPTWYYPPLYVPPPRPGFFFGFAVGVAWGHCMWGGCHWGWGHCDVNINVNRYNTFVNRTERPENRARVENRAKNGNWQHDPSHRKGVAYRDSKTARNFGASRDQTRVTRDQARGFSSDRATRGGATTRTPTMRAPSTQRPSANRPTTPRPGSRQSQTGTRSSSLSGARVPNLDRAASTRGHTSRGSRAGGRAMRGGGGRGRPGRGKPKRTDPQPAPRSPR